MRVLSGIQPSGDVHYGNYFGYLKHNIDLLDEGDIFLMIADLHALTTVHDPELLRKLRQQLVVDFLACGFDPAKGILFFQSFIPQHAELSWILSCCTPMGLLERAVSYKDKTERGLEANVGLFTYPVLQTADILLYDADTVPVGKDQKQHIEIARDIAQKFNNRYGDDVFVLPEAKIRDDVAIIPGTDGQKMSKSYGNTLQIFGDEAALKKAIMSIETDSRDKDDPKDPDTCTIYQIHKHMLSSDEQVVLADEYKNGLPYGEAKKRLFSDFFDYFGPMRECHQNTKEAEAVEVIKAGSEKASETAQATMMRVRKAVGLY